MAAFSLQIDRGKAGEPIVSAALMLYNETYIYP